MILIAWIILIPLQACMVSILAMEIVEIKWLGFLTAAPSLILLAMNIYERSRIVGLKSAAKQFSMGEGTPRNIAAQNQIPIESIPLSCGILGLYFVRNLVEVSKNFESSAATIIVLFTFAFLHALACTLFSEGLAQTISLNRIRRRLGHALQGAFFSMAPLVVIKVSLSWSWI